MTTVPKARPLEVATARRLLESARLVFVRQLSDSERARLRPAQRGEMHGAYPLRGSGSSVPRAIETMSFGARGERHGPDGDCTHRIKRSGTSVLLTRAVPSR